MISHEHRCIFIHISKCAGTSVERALGVKGTELNYDVLYGWCPKSKLYLQHATPQQLLDLGYIDRNTWESYYKFIIVRNPWDRAYSDYLWILNNIQKYTSFKGFLSGTGPLEPYFSKETDYNISDHRYAQSDYFVLDGAPIKYDLVIQFESIKEGLNQLANQIGIAPDLFKKPANVNKKKHSHYSLFFSSSRKQMVSEYYAEDIAMFDYDFDDQRSWGRRMLNSPWWAFHPNGGRYFRLKYPKLGGFLLKIKKLFG